MEKKICDNNLAVLLNLQMIIDYMDEMLWQYTAHRAGETASLSGCLLYFGQSELYDDTLYIIPEGSESGFPADNYCYITTGSLRGKAPHIREIKKPMGEVLNHVIQVFQRFKDFECSLNRVISTGGSLSELCRVGSAFLNNPVYIHDNYFAIVAESCHVEGMIDFEYNEKTQKMYIPLWLIDEFKFDDYYKHTLTLRQASIWENDQYLNNMRSLFVNLWDGEEYLGRLMVNEVRRPLQPGHFRIAEFLARYVIAWIRNQEHTQHNRNHNFEETFADLITTGEADEQDLNTILGILDWKEYDHYLCLKVQNQVSGNVVRSDSALNGRLTSMLNGCMTFRQKHQLCVIINLDVSKTDEGTLRIQLAPLIRDGCLHAGMSNPVKGIYSIYNGFIQADIALDYIANTDSSDWMVSFSSCALSYIRKCACKGLPSHMVAHPVLQELKEHDITSGTQYYETLRAYLLCERSIPLTASYLIIHRTTLTYRLGKLQEITRLNLDDANLRLYLLLSYQLLEQGR